MQSLQQLLLTNKGKGQFYAADKNSDVATVYLYDAIVNDPYFGGVSALDFAKELASITAPVINLRINSPGGDVFAARAIAQSIKEHPANIIAYVDGIAASAATFPLVAANSSVIAEGGMVMIHNAWSIGMGNSNDFLELAGLLDRVDASLRESYAAKTGKSIDEIKSWMDAETYFIGQEAVDAGLVDGMIDTPVKNKIKWDLSAYLKAPKIEDKEEFIEVKEFDYSDLYRSLYLKEIAV